MNENTNVNTTNMENYEVDNFDYEETSGGSVLGKVIASAALVATGWGIKTVVTKCAPVKNWINEKKAKSLEKQGYTIARPVEEKVEAEKVETKEESKKK